MILYFQTDPLVIFNPEGNTVIKEFREGTDYRVVCRYIDEVLEDDVQLFTNNLFFNRQVNERTKKDCKYKYFQSPIKEITPEPPVKRAPRKDYSQVELTDDTRLKLGKYTGQLVKDVPKQYIEWFKKNIPKSRW